MVKSDQPIEIFQHGPDLWEGPASDVSWMELSRYPTGQGNTHYIYIYV